MRTICRQLYRNAQAEMIGKVPETRDEEILSVTLLGTIFFVFVAASAWFIHSMINLTVQYFDFIMTGGTAFL
ncbi:MAG: hypothetical protein Q8Q39_03530 [bacterium]|nr:hypothetical protein [bacterium]